MIVAVRVLAASLLLCIEAAPAQQARYRDAVFAEVEMIGDIAYGWAFDRHTGWSQELLSDLYQPRGDTAARRPAVVVAHGGGFRAGDKRDREPARIASDLAARGFVALSVNYRLVPAGHPPDRSDIADAGADLAAAVRWLRRNADLQRVDPERIAVIGNSAGAIAGCEAAYARDDGAPGGAAALAAAVDLWGFLANPAALDRREAPLLIVHGTRDSEVPFWLSTWLYERALAIGADATLVALSGEGHEPWPTYFASVHEQTIAFLHARLRLAQLAGLDARRPPPPAPDALAIDTFGEGGDAWILMASGARGPGLALGALGTFELDPAGFVALPQGSLPPGLAVSTAGLVAPIPGALAGRVVHWQALHVRGDGTPRLLTNAMGTRL